MDLAVPADHIVNGHEGETLAKYKDIARELNKVELRDETKTNHWWSHHTIVSNFLFILGGGIMFRQKLVLTNINREKNPFTLNDWLPRVHSVGLNRWFNRVLDSGSIFVFGYTE